MVLTRRQKIGQLLVVGVPGQTSKDVGIEKLVNYAKSGEVGGFIPYGYNIIDRDQILELNNLLKETARQWGLPEFLCAVDVEGGKVDRLPESKGFGPGTPSAQDVADLSIGRAKTVYRQMSKRIKNAGFNWVYAPDVDMNVNGHKGPVIGELERSYGEESQVIVRFASILIEEARNMGLLSCAKHYPGHGSAWKDSHQGFTDVTEVWKEEEMEPFFDLSRAGLLDSVMTGHLFNKNLDPINQATMSKVTLDRLRQAGFNGVIVSDDLHMGAIQEKYGFAESIEKSLNAGVDMIIFSNNVNAAKNIPGFQPDLDLPRTFCDVVEEAICEGRISEARIEEAFQRVLELKRHLLA